jgi:TrmH family RNA methyltransferase
LPLPADLPAFRLTRPLFEELDIVGTAAALLVGELPVLASIDLSTPPQGLELVCALGNPDNLGALLRSAAAFGVSRVVLLPAAAHPFHPKCLRSGANAQFELSLWHGPDWAALEQAAGPLLALDGGGESLSDFSWPRHLRLVLGEEGQGLPGDLAAQRLAIPVSAAVESLNATVAASIALYSYSCRWGLGGG